MEMKYLGLTIMLIRSKKNWQICVWMPQEMTYQKVFFYSILNNK